MLNFKYSTCLFILLMTACQIMPAYASQSKAMVQVSRVDYIQKSPQIEMNAKVFSQHEIRITAAIDGQLAYVADIGEYVAKGGIIAQLDTRMLALEIREKQLQIQKAEQLLSYLTSRLNRLTSIARKNVTELEVDTAVSEHNIAKSDLALLMIQLEQLEDKVKRAVMRAPHNGIVTQRRHNVGEYINQRDIIVNMLDLSQLEVRLDIPLKYRSYIKVGDEVALTTRETEFTVPVSALIPSIDMRLQTFEMRIRLPPTLAEHLNVGQLVSVAIPMSQSQQLAVHRDALVIRNKGIYVFKLDELSKQVKRIPVKVGQGDGMRVTVEGALKVGDKVVIRGAERLEHGQQVTVNNALIDTCKSGGCEVVRQAV